VGIPDKPEATSLTGYIKELLNSEWALKGRTSAEILEMAKTHGITSLRDSSLSSILIGLVNTSKIRRNKRPEDARWMYYPSSEYALSRHQ
jgi:hypothetical protein